MEKQIIISIVLTCLLTIAISAFPQSNINIDPRQYVTELYRKTPTVGKLDTIWNWEKRFNVPNQKIYFLDVDGEIKINFNHSGLIENKDFEGTFSLEAEISGTNGTRKIEVNPYSEIGEHRTPIGIKSDPPAEIAKKLLNMLNDLKDAQKIYKSVMLSNQINNEYFFSDIPMDIFRKKDEFNLLAKNTKDAIRKDTKTKLPEQIAQAKALYQIARTNFIIYTFSDPFNDISTKDVLLSKIDSFIDYYNLNIYENLMKRFRENYTEGLKYEQLKLDHVLSYMNSFEKSGEDATKAFLHLLNKDIIGYYFLKNSLIGFQTKITTFNINAFFDNNSKIDSILLKNRDLILETSKSLAEISKIEGTQLEKIIADFGDTKDINVYSTEMNTVTGYFGKENVYYIIEKYNDKLDSIISREAGRMIYKKLVYASIDLGKSGAKNGEVLNIYISWLMHPSSDSISTSPRLPIGKYYLRETGWRIEIQDMFALVKRIDQSLADTATLSPSNFKGSGGAVLMWTYFKEDKGIKISNNEINKNEYKVRRVNRFMNFWEPSFGINVSYLDFSTKLDIEIGTGVQLGLFHNKIFFGYGVNLQLISTKYQAPTYLYIGFSFARLFDVVKSSNSVTVAQ